MGKLRRHRLLMLAWLTSFLGLALGMLLYSLRDNLSVYVTPSELKALKHVPKSLDLGGLVAQNSFFRLHGVQVRFVLTDFQQQITVFYTGILPALFREGQGVIVSGALQNNGSFIATRVLAKHDENYRPPHLPNTNGKSNKESQ